MLGVHGYDPVNKGIVLLLLYSIYTPMVIFIDRFVNKGVHTIKDEAAIGPLESGGPHWSVPSPLLLGSEKMCRLPSAEELHS